MLKHTHPPAAEAPLAARHTPGPWRVSPPPSPLAVLRADGLPVCGVDSDDESGAADCDAEEALGNATLIAAAPDLLASADDLIELCCWLVQHVDWAGPAVAPGAADATGRRIGAARAATLAARGFAKGG